MKDQESHEGSRISLRTPSIEMTSQQMLNSSSYPEPEAGYSSPNTLPTNAVSQIASDGNRSEPIRERNLLQRFCRILSVAGFALILGWVGTFYELKRLAVGLSPWVSLSSFLAGSVVLESAWAALTLGLAATLRRRFFCRWICPTGQCLDWAGSFGKRLGLKGVPFPKIGWGIALATLAGALLGYPLMLWLDPLALFAAGVQAVRLNPANTVVYGLLPLSIILITVVFPGLWCTRLCPLGGFQETLYSIGHLECRSSGTREQAKEQAARSAGMVAGQIEKTPRRIDSKQDSEDESVLRSSRRVAIASAGGAILGWFAVCHTTSSKPRLLRPPGAVEESVFTGLCVRCGQCVESCPESILFPQPLESGWLGWFTPVVHFEEGYCREGCTRCTEVCPSRAIGRVKPAEKVQAIIGFPQVDMGVCLLGEEAECWACVRACPYSAIRYEFSEETYTTIPVIDPRRCPGCGACQVACPTKPKAIVVAPGHPLRPVSRT